MSIWHWADWFEPVPPQARITLGEGDTPLIHSRAIGVRAGLSNFYVKVESTPPPRPMTLPSATE